VSLWRIVAHGYHRVGLCHTKEQIAQGEPRLRLRSAHWTQSMASNQSVKVLMLFRQARQDCTIISQIAIA
jgi:hypothetical protein